MNQLRAVFFYEWKRSLTFGRIAWWFFMASFPIAITIMIRLLPDFQNELSKGGQDTIWAILLYVLIPCVCSALSVLLTAGPAVAAELEQRSWVYLATRPNGIFWLLIGKYLVAVTWGVTAAWFGTAGAVFCAYAGSDLTEVSVTQAAPNSIADESGDENNSDKAREFKKSGKSEAIRSAPLQIFGAITALSLLSCVAYSAVYLMIGTLFPKRAMVFCVMYTGFVEVVLGFIPALVNRLTVQYRLRSLLVKWVPTDKALQNSSAFEYVFGGDSSIVHCFWLLTLASLFLAAALVIAHRKEFTTASEGDM